MARKIDSRKVMCYPNNLFKSYIVAASKIFSSSESKVMIMAVDTYFKSLPKEDFERIKTEASRCRQDC